MLRRNPPSACSMIPRSPITSYKPPITARLGSVTCEPHDHPCIVVQPASLTHKSFWYAGKSLILHCWGNLIIWACGTITSLGQVMPDDGVLKGLCPHLPGLLVALAGRHQTSLKSSMRSPEVVRTSTKLMLSHLTSNLERSLCAPVCAD